MITSAPYGCWRFSIERTATGWPLSRSSSVATTVVVPRSNAIANRRAVVSPGSRSISSWSHTTAVTSNPDVRRTPPERPQHLDRRVRLEVVERVEHPLEIRALVLHRRLVQHQVALLHRRAQDHVAPDAGQRRLRPRLERRHLDDQVAARGRAAREPPALAQLIDGERARVERARPARRPTRSARGTSCTSRARRRSSRSRSRSSSRRRTRACRSGRGPPRRRAGTAGRTRSGAVVGAAAADRPARARACVAAATRLLTTRGAPCATVA